MIRIEIFARPGTTSCQEIERCCILMGYPHEIRDVRNAFVMEELKRRRSLERSIRGAQVFIGAEHIGGAKELLALEPFQIQQKLQG
jgi:hypothetical protein